MMRLPELTSTENVFPFFFFGTIKQVKALSIVDEKKNQNHVHAFIDWCFRSCNAETDDLKESFCQYIGKSCYKVENLKAYPCYWDYRKKGDCLMFLVGADHSNMRKYLGEHGAGLRWPFQSESRVHASLPSLLQKIIDWEEDNGKK